MSLADHDRIGVSRTMLGLSHDAYLVIKALHIVAVMAWMAGLWYLPRLFVYHAETPAGPQAETFKIMERRLLRGIMNPAMIAVFLLGGLMLAEHPELGRAGWLHGKLGLVLVLAGLHGFLAGCRKAFAADRNTRSARVYRLLNEIPTVLVVVIAILAVVKPF